MNGASSALINPATPVVASARHRIDADALANWHAAIKADDASMRPGIATAAEAGS